MDELSASSNTPIEFNTYIIAVNDEERSIEAIKKLHNKNVQIKTLLVVNYFYEDAKLVGVVTKRLPKYESAIQCINVDMYDPLDCINKIRVVLEKTLISESDSIGIDITCFPIPHFFLILKYFSSLVKNIIVHYTEPLNYIMNSGIFKSYFSTKGPINTDEIKGFPGITAKNGSNERVLFCLLGFDNDLLPTVIQDSSPSKIVTINGFPSFYPKFKDISLVNNEKILSSSDYADLREKEENFKNLVYVEANNPFDVINALEGLKQKHRDRCIDIVPIGTKPMALGVCLFSIYNDDIRVIYPFPEEYITTTTKECKKSWEYVVRLKEAK